MKIRALFASLLVLGASTGVPARTAKPAAYATAKTRDIVGGRKVLLAIPQTSIFAARDEALDVIDWAFQDIRVGLLVTGLFLIDRRNTPKELATTDPAAGLRAALTGYDFDGPLQAALLPAIKGSAWVRPQDIEYTRAGDAPSIEQKLDASNTRQMLNVLTAYFIDAKFRYIVVTVDSTILVRRIPKGQHSDARLKTDYIPFRQIFRCFVYLPGSNEGSIGDNAARWSADNGALARRALDLGIARVGALFARHLDATKESAALWTKRGDRKTVKRMRVIGWDIERDGNSLLFASARDDALNYIETLE